MNILGAVIILGSLILVLRAYAAEETPLLGNTASHQAAYQKYLNDQDNKLKEIDYLLDLIEHSSLSFERNGKKASGKDAVKLLKYKWNKNNNKIHTTEDFIEKVASFSNQTKKSYYVILPEGRKILLKDLLYSEMNKLRNGSK